MGSFRINLLTPFIGWIALLAAGMTTSKPTTSEEAAFGSSGISTLRAIIFFFFTILEVMHFLCLSLVAILKALTGCEACNARPALPPFFICLT